MRSLWLPPRPLPCAPGRAPAIPGLRRGRSRGGCGLGAAEPAEPPSVSREEDDARRAQVSRAGGSPPQPQAGPRLSLAGFPARGLEPAPEGAAGRAQAAAGSAAAAAAEARLRGEGWPFPSAGAPRSLASAEGRCGQGARVTTPRAQACAGTRRGRAGGSGFLGPGVSSGMGCVATQTGWLCSTCLRHGTTRVGAHALHLGT